MVRTRIEHHQREREEERLPGDVNDGLDPMTASELQWGGMRCRVLGTFYIEDDQLRLGSDIESFMSLSRMRAYKPRASALEMIVNRKILKSERKRVKKRSRLALRRYPSRSTSERSAIPPQRDSTEVETNPK